MPTYVYKRFSHINPANNGRLVEFFQFHFCVFFSNKSPKAATRTPFTEGNPFVWQNTALPRELCSPKVILSRGRIPIAEGNPFAWQNTHNHNKPSLIAFTNLQLLHFQANLFLRYNLWHYYKHNLPVCKPILLQPDYYVYIESFEPVLYYSRFQ